MRKMYKFESETDFLCGGDVGIQKCKPKMVQVAYILMKIQEWMQIIRSEDGVVDEIASGQRLVVYFDIITVFCCQIFCCYSYYITLSYIVVTFYLQFCVRFQEATKYQQAARLG